jgi:pilus assembly protein CpaB
MRAKTLILVMIAMVCGLLATIGISQVIERKSKSGPAPEMLKIFVAATDIDIGDALNAQNVRLEEWPREIAPEGAIIKLEDLENRYARQRFFEGEPVMSIKLMDSNSDNTMTIPEGYRACSIKVSGEVVVGNLVKPGDRVDVIVFLRKNGDVPITGTRTILRDVRIWAVNSKTERSIDDQGQSLSAQTVSLLVTSRQAELLTLASQLGQLRLTLRRPNDQQGDETDGTTIDSFLNETRYADASASIDGSGNSSVIDFLNQIGVGSPAAAAAPPPATTVEPAPVPAPVAASTPEVVQTEPPPPLNPVVFSMLVHTPQGLARYDWTDESQLPQQVQLVGNSPSPRGSSALPTLSVPPPGLSTPNVGELPAGSSWLDDTQGTKVNVP